MKVHIIESSSEEESVLRGLLSKGKHGASVRNRAQVLLMSHRGLRDACIESTTGLDARSVRRIRRRYGAVGFERCLYGAPRSGRPRQFDTRDEAELTALACSAAPDGRSRWTLGLLKSHMQKPIGLTSVYLLLKKTTASRGGIKCGASEKSMKNTAGGCMP